MSNDKNIKAARDLLLHHTRAILCTNSLEMPGYPFGSAVPYVLDQQGQPVILISRLAEHTRNIEADHKVSLIMVEAGMDDIQDAGRITCVGDARPLPDECRDPMLRYFEFFPDTRDYLSLDFVFYTIELKRVRYIGGFGKIHWIDADEFLKPNPFDLEQEQGILRHMNSDHADAIRHYCDLYYIHVMDDVTPVMVGVDGEGFHIRVGKRVYRIDFEQPVSNNDEVRQALVELAKREKAA